MIQLVRPIDLNQAQDISITYMCVISSACFYSVCKEQANCILCAFSHKIFKYFAHFNCNLLKSIQSIQTST